MILNVPYHGQESDHASGPASLRMLLAFHGIHKTEEDLVEQGRSSFAETCGGVLADTASRFRISVAHVGLSLASLCSYVENGIPVLVLCNDHETNTDRFAVVVGHTDTEIIVHDPVKGEGMAIENGRFEEEWTSADGRIRGWGMFLE